MTKNIQYFAQESQTFRNHTDIAHFWCLKKLIEVIQVVFNHRGISLNIRLVFLDIVIFNIFIISQFLASAEPRNFDQCEGEQKMRRK